MKISFESQEKKPKYERVHNVINENDSASYTSYSSKISMKVNNGGNSK